jgi:hypothetical protein
MKRKLLSKYSSNILYYFQSRITATKSRGLIFVVLFAALIVYYLLFYYTQIKTTIVYINHNLSSESRVYQLHSFGTNEKLVPDFINQVIDKVQKPATCLVIIRTTDGGIGNRMFLFASAYGLARLHQCDLYVAPWILTDLRSIFIINLNNTPIHLITNDSVVNQTGLNQRFSACTLFDDLLKVPLNPNLTVYEMTGFYQAFGYFVKYKDEISYLFQFNQLAIGRNLPLVEQLLKGLILFDRDSSVEIGTQFF